MANEVRKKVRTIIAAQAAGAYVAAATPLTGSSGGATTMIDNSYDGGAENGLGADLAQLTFHCTAAPATITAVDIWYRGSSNSAQTDVTRWRYSHTIGETIQTTADVYDAGEFNITYPFLELSAAAVSYALSGHLDALLVLPEIQ